MLPMLLALALATEMVLPTQAAFSDTAGHQMEEAINKWSSDYNIITGYEDGTFRPDEHITRGAFAGILDRFLKYQDISPSNTFSDTSDNYWKESILKLHAAGVYLGNQGKALARNSITRQQALTMVARAFAITDTSGGADKLPYSDAAEVASYARGPLAEMTARGWITDSTNGLFRPTDEITRAEFVNLLDHVVDTLIQTSTVYTESVDGTLMINSLEGATLKDITVSGDLIIAPGVSGTVILQDVTIQGQLRNFSKVTPTTISIGSIGDPPAQDPSTQDPSTQNPSTQDPSTQNPSTQDPSTQNPSTQDPSTQNPSTQLPPIDPSSPISPSAIYTPSATTGEYITFEGDKIPVRAGTKRNTLKAGDFVWSSTKKGRLEYVGTEFDTRFGIDVSAYQNRDSKNETIDWNAVRNDGVEFSMIRVAFRGYTSGKLSEDPFAKQNIQGSMAAGIDTGVYVFAQAISVEEAIEEADFVINILKDQKISGPVAYDWEINDPKYRGYNVSPEMATACAIAFCKRIEQAGYKPMIYAGNFVGYRKYDQGVLAPYLSWYPQYKTTSSSSLYPSFYYQMDYWQFTDGCPIKGIGNGTTTKVDADIQFIPR